MSLIGNILGPILTPVLGPIITPSPTPTPTPTPPPTASPTPPPTTASSATPTTRRRRAEPEAATPSRRWGEAGTLSISPQAVRAERRMRVEASGAERSTPADPAATSRTAADIIRDAAQSLIAQANVDRSGTVDLLLK